MSGLPPRTRRRRRHGAGQLGYWKAETPNIRSDWYITGDTMMRATAPLSPAIASMQLDWSGCPIVAGKLCNLHGINYSRSQAWIEIAHRPFIEINDPNQALG